MDIKKQAVHDLAAPVTASFLGKQLVKHEITAENTKKRYGELSEQAKTKYSELSDRTRSKIESYRTSSDDSVGRANPKRRRRKKI